MGDIVSVTPCMHLVPVCKMMLKVQAVPNKGRIKYENTLFLFRFTRNRMTLGSEAMQDPWRRGTLAAGWPAASSQKYLQVV